MHFVRLGALKVHFVRLGEKWPFSRARSPIRQLCATRYGSHTVIAPLLGGRVETMRHRVGDSETMRHRYRYGRTMAHRFERSLS